MHFCSESSKAESTSQQNSLKSITKEREETFKKRLLKASKSDVKNVLTLRLKIRIYFHWKLLDIQLLLITLLQKDFQERFLKKIGFFLGLYSTKSFDILTQQKVFGSKLMNEIEKVLLSFISCSFLSIYFCFFRYSEEDDSKGQCDLLAYSSDPLKQSMETLADPKYNIYQKDGSCDDLNNLNLNSEMPRSRELTGKIANDPPPPYSRPQFSGFLGNSFFHVQNLKPQYSTNQKIDGGFFNTAASLLVGEGIRYNNEGKMIPFHGFQF